MKKKLKKSQLHKKLGFHDTKILKEYHQFLRDSGDEELRIEDGMSNEDYGKLLAKRYYKKLYKRYALVDLTYFKQGR